MSTNTLTIIILAVIVGIILGYLIAKIYFLVSLKHQRSDAVMRSRSVVLGHVNEKIAPLLPDFPYSFKDLVFLGKGIDYLVFDGLAKGDLQKIVFLEVKSGESQLNKNEQMIKKAIERQAISYEIFRK